MSNKKWKNPFYTLLIPAGAVFCLTAVAYGYMAFQQVNSGLANAKKFDSHPLYVWLQEHGTIALVVELIVLAILTVGAISTDSWWTSDE